MSDETGVTEGGIDIVNPAALRQDTINFAANHMAMVPEIKSLHSESCQNAPGSLFAGFHIHSLFLLN